MSKEQPLTHAKHVLPPERSMSIFLKHCDCHAHSVPLNAAGVSQLKIDKEKTRHTTYVVFGRAETNRRTATAAFYFAMLPRMCTKPNESRSQKIQGKTSRPCRRLHSYVKVTGKAICLLTWHDEQQLTYNSTYTCTVYIYIVKSCEQMIKRYDMCYKMKKYVEV